MAETPQITIWSDGSCHPNPGPGGWAALLLYHKPGREKPIGKWLSGGLLESTNNRMELTGVIEGLKALKVPANVTIYSDSQYVTEGIGAWKSGQAVPPLGWLPKWVKNDWMRTRDNTPVMNKDLWELLHNLVSAQASVRTRWVRGHNDDTLNEECDRRADAARLEIIALNNALTVEPAECVPTCENGSSPSGD